MGFGEFEVRHMMAAWLQASQCLRRSGSISKRPPQRVTLDWASRLQKCASVPVLQNQLSSFFRYYLSQRSQTTDRCSARPISNTIDIPSRIWLTTASK